MQRKINLQAVNNVKPGPKRVFLWDTEVKGFGFMVTPGGAKSYILQYRAGMGRSGISRRMTIGHHGSPWTPDTARREAIRLLGEVVGGNDPAAERTKARKGMIVAQLAERFLEEHVKPKTRPSTAKRYEALLNKTILPALGRRKVADITRAEVSDLHYSRRHVPRDANHMLAVLSKLFNLAERWGLRPDGSNPARNVERYPERHRERFLTEKELARLGAALTEGEREGSLVQPPRNGKPERKVTVNPTAIATIRLLVLTGARKSEVLGLRWEWIDMEGRTVRLPESKTGRKTIYLNAPACALIGSLPRIEGVAHVFPGNRDGRSFNNIEETWRAVREHAELDDVRLHDLRHTHASVGVAGGLSLPVIGGLLGHTVPTTTARYAHLSANPLQTASEMIGDRIAQAMQGKAQHDNVVAMPDRKPRRRIR